MTSAIVLPGLTDWTEEHITAIYSATTAADFESAFDAFLSQNVSITSNGVHLTRDQYKQKLLTQKSGEISGGVSFTSVVEVDGKNGQPSELVAGNVGLSFQATISIPTTKLGEPSSNLVDSSLNVTIIEDPTLQSPTKPPIRGDFDPRRVSVLNEVVTEKPNPLIALSTPTTA